MNKNQINNSLSKEHLDKIAAWQQEIAEYYRGHTQTIKLALTALISDGHVLLEDLPGSGKTLLAKAIASSIGISEKKMISSFQRAQFTPDLLPMDILGVNIYNPGKNCFHFQPGPIFTNLLLVDEINRASPKVQSALLEAMGEKQVTIDKKTYYLEELFFVIGTQNPIDHEGVYPLPQAQLDRFMLCLRPGYIAKDFEKEILCLKGRLRPDLARTIVSDKDILAWRQISQGVVLSDAVYDAVLSILTWSRQEESLRGGLSTRAGIHLVEAIKTWSLINNPDPALLPDDFRLLCEAVLTHRLPVQGWQDSSPALFQEIIIAETEKLVKKNLASFRKLT